MKWQDIELQWIDIAIGNIHAGSSIYSQIKWLQGNKLFGRSDDSIRSKLGRRLKNTDFENVPTFKQTKC